MFCFALRCSLQIDVQYAGVAKQHCVLSLISLKICHYMAKSRLRYSREPLLNLGIAFPRRRGS